MSEAAFLQNIMDDPAGAATTWLVLADWLEEHSDPRAELVRLLHDPRYRPGWTPLQRDEHVRERLAAGVLPCVPTVVNSVGMRFALIPAGKFLMGSPDSEEGRFDDEGPQHEVEITRPFYLGVYPVTQQQYRKVMGTNPSHFTRKYGGGPTHAVDSVSWEDAEALCRRLSAVAEERAAGRRYQLPSEAEWEYACRGGASTSQPFHFGVRLSSEQANCDGTSAYGGADKGSYLQRTSAVGSYPPNAFGLYDLHGNVWEWCQDWYGENFYQEGNNKDPQGPVCGDVRVLRGGSWGVNQGYCRAANRGRRAPGDRYIFCGCRLLLRLD